MFACGRTPDAIDEIAETLARIEGIDANFTFKDYGYSALMYVAERGHVHLIPKLVDVPGIDLTIAAFSLIQRRLPDRDAHLLASMFRKPKTVLKSSIRF